MSKLRVKYSRTFCALLSQSAQFFLSIVCISLEIYQKSHSAGFLGDKAWKSRPSKSEPTAKVNRHLHQGVDDGSGSPLEAKKMFKKTPSSHYYHVYFRDSGCVSISFWRCGLSKFWPWHTDRLMYSRCPTAAGSRRFASSCGAAKCHLGHGKI